MDSRQVSESNNSSVSEDTATQHPHGILLIHDLMLFQFSLLARHAVFLAVSEATNSPSTTWHVKMEQRAKPTLLSTHELLNRDIVCHECLPSQFHTLLLPSACRLRPRTARSVTSCKWVVVAKTAPNNRQQRMTLNKLVENPS